jgi:hypothetical protein
MSETFSEYRRSEIESTMEDEMTDDAQIPVQVYRDGEPVSPAFDSELEAYAWLHRHQGQSVSWATTYEGYSIQAAWMLTCYLCDVANVEGVQRVVVKEGPVVDRADPTQTYILECGHVAI